MREESRFSRTVALVGEKGLQRLTRAEVTVFGLGGVGGYAAEALARAGVGRLVLVDCDVVHPSNINRQVLALDSTVGRLKADVARDRIQDINPACRVETVDVFITGERAGGLFGRACPETPYAVEAIDTVAPKLGLMAALRERGVCSVSCMGAATRLDPTQIRVDDISKTQGCPLTRRVRQRLRRRGIFDGVRVVYSVEPAKAPAGSAAGGEASAGPFEGRPPLGSLSFVPGIMGLTAAGVIINDILAGAS